MAAATVLVERAQMLQLLHLRLLELLCYMSRARCGCCWYFCVASGEAALAMTVRAAAAAAAVLTVKLERPGYYMPRMRARASGGRCCFCVWCG